MKSKKDILKLIQKDIFEKRPMRPIPMKVKIKPIDLKMGKNFEIELLYQNYLLKQLHKEIRKSTKI